jgi:hypothetical protein
MELAGVDEEFEFVVGQPDVSWSQAARETRSPSPVAGVSLVVYPPGVVKHGEQRDDVHVRTRDFRQLYSVFQHTSPVREAVEAHRIQRVTGKYFFDEFGLNQE